MAIPLNLRAVVNIVAEHFSHLAGLAALAGVTVKAVRCQLAAGCQTVFQITQKPERILMGSTAYGVAQNELACSVGCQEYELVAVLTERTGFAALAPDEAR